MTRSCSLDFRVLGLAVDSQVETLFACRSMKPFDKHNEITTSTRIDDTASAADCKVCVNILYK